MPPHPLYNVDFCTSNHRIINPYNNISELKITQRGLTTTPTGSQFTIFCEVRMRLCENERVVFWRRRDFGQVHGVVNKRSTFFAIWLKNFKNHLPEASSEYFTRNTIMRSFVFFWFFKISSKFRPAQHSDKAMCCLHVVLSIR